MKAYVTVLTNEKYIPGVMALQMALTKVNSKYPLMIIVPNNKADSLTEQMKAYGINTLDTVLAKTEIDVDIPIIEEEYTYWKETFFKLVVVSCIEFEKIVLLDSDMLIQHNIDQLFDEPHMSGVMAGVSVRPEWTDFNSGMLVIEPDMDIYQQLINSIIPAIKSRRAQGLSAGDQDVFHYMYPDWYHNKRLILSETYNCLWGYINMVCIVEHCKPNDINIIHFIGKKKPWEYSKWHWVKLILSWVKNGEKNLVSRALIWRKYWSYTQKHQREE